MNIKPLTTYAYYGRVAFNKGKTRKANPYNFRSHKGHEWDDGWLYAQAMKLKAIKRRAKSRIKQKIEKNLKKNEKFLQKTETFFDSESEKK